MQCYNFENLVPDVEFVSFKTITFRNVLLSPATVGKFLVQNAATRQKVRMDFQSCTHMLQTGLLCEDYENPLARLQ